MSWLNRLAFSRKPDPFVLVSEPEHWTFDSYQQEALVTAQCPLIGTPLVYPLLGLAGEIGEVYEKVLLAYPEGKKEHPCNETRLLIAHECGDVLWYTAVMADRLGSKFHELVCSKDISLEEYAYSVEDSFHCYTGQWNKIPYRLDRLVIAQGQLCERVKKMFRDGDGQLTGDRRGEIYAGLRSVFMALTGLAACLEINLGVIAQANIQKLRHRRARNTIQGEGDNR